MNNLMLEKNQNIIIIGAGPAGLSLSATLKMCSISHIVLEKASNSGGQIFYINNPLEDLIIDDLNTGKDLIFKFENFTKKYNLPVKYENEILKIDTKNSTILVKHLDNHSSLKYNKLVIASGCRLNMNKAFNGSGFDDDIYHRISGKIDDFKNKIVAIVGNGDNAAIACLKISNIAQNIILINRSEIWKARRDLVEKILKLANVKVFYSSNIIKVKGNQKIESAEIQSKSIKIKIQLDKLIFKIGYIPNTEFLNGVVEIDKDGYIIGKEKFLTSNPNIFAIGDVLSGTFKRIAIAMAHGTELGNYLIR